jgi:hypothetical protein
MARYTVTLYNQFAQCGIKAEGHYPLHAYLRARAKAGLCFTRYRGNYCALNDGAYDELWAQLSKSWKARKAKPARIHVEHNGLGVEMWKETT